MRYLDSKIKKGGDELVNSFKKVLAGATSAAVIFGSMALPAFAKPPGAQVFDIYDNTNDGLVVGTDPDTGNVRFEANPGGANRIIVEAHLQKAAPNCTYDVQLVRDTAASNGGLNAAGHSGSIQVLGTLATNGVGNGNAHFDLDPSGDGVGDTAAFGHLDFEDPSGSCVEADGTPVVNNEYGAAPDPTLLTPLNWLE
ncbi:MAG: hypothetical protein US86_C0002G0090 [Candidatus Daviesbacteria bacterium GW2011_GWA2_38_24]|uniref:Uncharacterized protein n=1 Tax=Candidatus Daviesbacteria bacterium GW2011_GWA2_38_24 TaxID=1618422 RepID=A0A0G0JH22_9BACT|nr:MAG: hypothetical protein US86_C0002G0090 [Candidatus Daviesbacteria bacterium GW2011_GWA2_38_24]KKQ79831.1 MAG: hypothetical protein UT01_C0027G0016 [Candidatus Daviesbacteria bacterium GW2011_GWA1_38_7]OGE22980.1 MAG: hypothetical protein A2688_03250 [Candidatus Daviesbacteria bacterium RIFCSPHIGHO2_01_FULL_38_8]